jgi:hypothetical protein
MLRKTILALSAAAALGATTLAPTSAFAWGGHGGWGWHGPGFRVFAGPVFAGPVYDACLVRTWVATPYGPALRWVNRCY